MLRVITIEDLKVILHYTGRIIRIVAYLMLIPLLTALVFLEWRAFLEFLFSFSVTLSVGLLLEMIGKTELEPKMFHAMTIAAFSWLVAMVMTAIPYYLSGHVRGFLDGCFDAMSGYTTTGLILIQDLEHVSNALNMWRHLVTFTGGQGIIVLTLTFLVTPSGGAYKIMVGEGKDERLFPNVRNTAIQIWRISMIYLCIGTLVLGVIAYLNGLSPVSSFLNGLWMFMSAWSTGGFAPYSQNLMYYHSFLFEIVVMIFMVIGSLNFALHNAIWTGKFREIFKDIEARSFMVTLSITSFIVFFGLVSHKIYGNLISLFRFGLIQAVSAHTTTGVSTVYSVAFYRQWGELAIIGLILAMAIGGSAASTAGGFKGIRMGILFKGITHTIKSLMSVEGSKVSTKIHHIRDMVLTDEMVKMAGLIVIFYIFIYMLGTVVGVFYGYPFINAMFEAVSAGSNSGLSCGIVSPSMPTLLKVIYIFEMWAGRLEFLAVFVFFNFIFLGIFGRRRS